MSPDLGIILDLSLMVSRLGLARQDCRTSLSSSYRQHPRAVLVCFPPAAPNLRSDPARSPDPLTTTPVPSLPFWK